jgi:hypothetical protein
VVSAYRRAVDASETDVPHPQRHERSSRNGGVAAAATTAARAPRPPVPTYLAITEYSQQQLRSIVRWVQSDTLLRTHDELLTEVMSDLGFQKRGKRIVGAIEQAIAGEQRQAG